MGKSVEGGGDMGQTERLLVLLVGAKNKFFLFGVIS